MSRLARVVIWLIVRNNGILVGHANLVKYPNDDRRQVAVTDATFGEHPKMDEALFVIETRDNKMKGYLHFILFPRYFEKLK